MGRPREPAKLGSLEKPSVEDMTGVVAAVAVPAGLGHTQLMLAQQLVRNCQLLHQLFAAQPGLVLLDGERLVVGPGREVVGRELGVGHTRHRARPVVVVDDHRDVAPDPAAGGVGPALPGVGLGRVERAGAGALESGRLAL